MTRKISILTFIVFYKLFCFSQPKKFIDTTIFKNSAFSPLLDCQKFTHYNWENADSSHLKFINATIGNLNPVQLVRSYQFDNNGNIKKLLYSENGRDIDSTLAVYNYDQNNRLLSSVNYNKHLSDTLIEKSKILYFYNKDGLLEKKVGFEINDTNQIFDTTYVQEFNYNSKGLKTSENLRSMGYILMSTGTGFQKFSYDEKDRIKEIKKIATTGINSSIKSPENNFTAYYNYFGDSSYTETLVFNLDNQKENTFWEKTIFLDSTGKFIKTVRTYVQSVEILFVIGKYFPDPESKTAYIQKQTTIYQYDNLGRIEKVITNFESDDKRTDWKTQGQYFQTFKYKDNKLYILPKEEYVDE